jgi:hypothetical protein
MLAVSQFKSILSSCLLFHTEEQRLREYEKKMMGIFGRRKEEGAEGCRKL